MVIEGRSIWGVLTRMGIMKLSRGLGMFYILIWVVVTCCVHMQTCVQFTHKIRVLYCKLCLRKQALKLPMACRCLWNEAMPLTTTLPDVPPTYPRTSSPTKCPLPFPQLHPAWRSQFALVWRESGSVRIPPSDGKETCKEMPVICFSRVMSVPMCVHAATALWWNASPPGSLPRPLLPPQVGFHPHSSLLLCDTDPTVLSLLNWLSYPLRAETLSVLFPPHLIIRA